MNTTTIKAIETVRRTRDAQEEQLRGKTPEERIAFYRAKAHQLQKALVASSLKQEAGKPQAA